MAVDFKNLTEDEKRIVSANFLKPKAELERLISEYRAGQGAYVKDATPKKTGVISGKTAVDRLLHTEIGIPVRVQSSVYGGFKQAVFMGIKDIQSRESFVFFTDEGLDGSFGLSARFIEENSDTVLFDFDNNEPEELAMLLKKINSNKQPKLDIYAEEVTGTLGRILDEVELPADIHKEVEDLYKNVQANENNIYPDEITGTLGRILDEVELSADIQKEIEDLYQRAVKML